MAFSNASICTASLSLLKRLRLFNSYYQFFRAEIWLPSQRGALAAGSSERHRLDMTIIMLTQCSHYSSCTYFALRKLSRHQQSIILAILLALGARADGQPGNCKSSRESARYSADQN